MSEVYEFIDAEYATSGAAPAITLMCRWLEVSKSGYYEWRSRPESATAKRREELKLLIKKAFDDSDGTYGYRRVWWQLARWGVRAGLELVRALMRELGLVACQPRPWRPHTTQQGHAGPIPDLVNRDFTADAPGRKMVGDITYIPTRFGWVAPAGRRTPRPRWRGCRGACAVPGACSLAAFNHRPCLARPSFLRPCAATATGMRLWRWARSATRRTCPGSWPPSRRVLAGHKSDGMPSPFCVSDGFSWPCPTCRAIARALDGER